MHVRTVAAAAVPANGAVTIWVTTGSGLLATGHVMTPDSVQVAPSASALDPGYEEPSSRRISIERNGEEYLVMINGAAFVALSRSQAEAIARRTKVARAHAGLA